jgi:DNA-binding NarL/FixJ family response regulator
MPSPLKFLVVDVHAESRFLLVKTLLRKFPDAIICEHDDAEHALAAVKQRDLAAIITHRTLDVPGVELVAEFRGADSNVPIVMVSGIDREAAALAAGASRFLHYDEWLRIGSVVEELLKRAAGDQATRGCLV